jgi:hypothetical protein
VCLALVASWFAVHATGGAGWPEPPRHAALVVIAVMVVGYIAGRPSRIAKGGVLFTALWRLIRSGEGRDLRAARGSAGTEGAVTRADGLTVWAEAGQARADELLGIVQATEPEFARLAGLTQPALKLRILAFDGMAGYQRYVASWRAPDVASAPMCIIRGRSYAIVMSTQGCQQALPSLGRLLAQQVAQALAVRRLGYAAMPWLVQGLSWEAMDAAGPTSAEPSARQRSARAAVARGEWLPGSRAVAMGYNEIQRAHRGQLADVARAQSLPLQFWALVHMLTQEHLREFQAFIRELQIPSAAGSPFERAFGFSADEAMESALARLTAGDLPPHREPPDALKWKIDAVFVPKLAASEAPEVRRGAAQALGALGYLWRAEALIELLGSPDEGLRIAARTALEDIAGELVGDDPAAWRAWLARARAAAMR